MLRVRKPKSAHLAITSTTVDLRELQFYINLFDTPLSVLNCGNESDGKRFATLQCERRVTVRVHCSNANCLPLLAFPQCTTLGGVSDRLSEL